MQTPLCVVYFWYRMCFFFCFFFYILSDMDSFKQGLHCLTLSEWTIHFKQGHSQDFFKYWGTEAPLVIYVFFCWSVILTKTESFLPSCKMQTRTHVPRRSRGPCSYVLFWRKMQLCNSTDMGLSQRIVTAVINTYVQRSVVQCEIMEKNKLHSHKWLFIYIWQCRSDFRKPNSKKRNISPPRPGCWF